MEKIFNVLLVFAVLVTLYYCIQKHKKEQANKTKANQKATSTPDTSDGHSIGGVPLGVRQDAMPTGATSDTYVPPAPPVLGGGMQMV